MSITRSLRPLAAAALAAGIALPGAASASHGPGGADKHGSKHDGNHDSVRHASSYSRHQRHTVDGVVQTSSGTTGPATLTVQTASGTTITVTVSATTKVVRGHGGRSSLGELAQGDRITADGSFENGSTTTFDARRITDLSTAYTHVVGTVAGVWTGGVTLSVARRGNPHSLYWRGEVVNVTLSPSTKVISGSVTQTASAVNWTQVPTLHVQVTGLYDAANPAQPTLRADCVRILGTRGRPDPVAEATPEAEAEATATTTPTPATTTPTP